jgi:methionine aminotransferase
MPSLNLKSKLPQVGTTIFTVMSKMAAEHNAINLSQGFPDFACDPLLVEMVHKSMQLGQNQYAPMIGTAALREEIALMVNEKYNAPYDPETEITVTSGATEALFCAIMTLVHEGDEVLIIEPAYDCYLPAIELAGGMAVGVQMDFPNYTVNWDAVKRLINRNTRVIIINSPHNPTGSTLTEADILQLEKLIMPNNIFVISDEVYEHIIFDGRKHESIARYPNLRERSMIVSSFGKTFHTTGWKVGYCLAPQSLSKEFRKVHQFVTFSTSTPFQMGIAEYMRNRANIDNLKDFYQEKRDYFLELMKETRFKPLKTEGTYFQLMSYADISDENDKAFCERLTKEFGVASIPVSVFYRKEIDNKVIRFCFAKENQTLEMAAEQLRKV